MNAVPAWLQIGMAVAGILAFLGGAAAFLFVIWPSIRRQNRLGNRIEDLINSERAKKIIDQVEKKFSDIGGKPVTSVKEFADTDNRRGGSSNL